MIRFLGEDTREAVRAMERDARGALANWILDQAQWDVFATITFRPPDGISGYSQRGTAYCWKQADLLLSLLRPLSPDWSLGSFLVEERHESGVPHLHGLIGHRRGCLPLRQGEPLLRVQAQLCKDVGWTVLRSFDEGRCGPLGDTGAVAYVGKYVTKGDNRWRLSV